MKEKDREGCRGAQPIWTACPWPGVSWDGGSALAVIRAYATAQTNRLPQASNKTRGAGPAEDWLRDFGGCQGPCRHRLAYQWTPRHRRLPRGRQTRAVEEMRRPAFPGPAR